MAPLCNRREDLPELIETFWQKHSLELGRKLALSPEARDLLMRYSYPGNIRELNNLIERLLVLGPETGEIHPGDLPGEVRSKQTAEGTSGWSPGRSLTEWLESLEAAGD